MVSVDEIRRIRQKGETDMEARLLALYTDETIGAQRLLEKLAGVLGRKYALGTAAFTQTDGMRGLFAAFADALKSAELIVLAFDPKLYVRARHKLASALGLSEKANEQVLSRIRDCTADLPGELLGEQAAFPEDAQVFLSADGLNSAYVIQKGRQSIYFFPLDGARLDGILQEGFHPELYKTLDAPVKIVGETVADAAESEAPEAPAEPERTNGEPLLQTVQALADAAVKIGVDGSKNAEVLKALGAGAPEFETVFSFTPHVEDKGEFNPADYTAQMAKTARELAKADFGACISDIYREQTEEYILVAAAGENAATVRKLYREENESEEEFLSFAANELASLLSETAEGGAPETADGRQGFWASRCGKLLLAVLLLCLLALAFGIAYLAIKGGADAAALQSARHMPGSISLQLYHS